MRGSAARLPLRVLALGYLAVILLVPVAAVIWRAFGDGLARCGRPSPPRTRSTPCGCRC
jgi:ABC-type sulfate transport system permease subunit